MDMDKQDKLVASPLSPATRVAQTAGVVLRHVAGENMLVPTVSREVDLDSLFLLNATGVFIWEQLDGRRTLQELSRAVATEFRVEEAIATADVPDFVASLLERKLAKRIAADDC